MHRHLRLSLLALCSLALGACPSEPSRSSGDARTDPLDAAFDASDVLDLDDLPGAPDVGDPTDASDVVARVDVPDLAEVPDQLDVPSDRPITLRCDGPRALRLPLDDVEGTLLNTGGTFGASERCAYDLTARGEEHVYSLTITARTGVELRTDTLGTRIDTVLSVRRACDDASSELACDDSSGAPAGTSRLRVILEPGDYRVIVDRYASGATAGHYYLSLRTFAPAPNALCAEANVLPPNTDVDGNTRGAAVRPAACDVGTTAQVFYRLTLPPRTRADLRLTASSAPGSSLAVVDDCDATTCVSSLRSIDATTFIGNASDRPHSVIVAVNSLSAATDASFTVRADVAPLASNATCLDAAPLAPGAAVTGNTNLALSARSGCAAAYGPQLFYRVTVPARSHLPVTLTPDRTNQFHLSVRDACTDVTCRDFDYVQGETRSTELLNGTDAPREYLVDVTGAADVPPGTFTLGAGAAVPLDEGLTCESAETLAPGTTVRGDLLGAVGTWANCRTNNLRQRQRGYAVTVPAGQRVDVTVQSESTTQVLLATPASCAIDALCRRADPSTVLTAALTNTGTVARTYPLALSTYRGIPESTSVSYTVTASAPVALVPGETCRNAELVAPGTTIAGTTATGATTSVCSANSPARYYRVVIAPATVGTITVTRASTNDSSVLLASGCPGFHCDPISTSSTVGGPAVWTYGNPGPAPVELVVTVYSRTGSPSSFTVGFATTPAPSYALSPAAAPACEVLDAPEHVSLRGSNQVTPPIVLPFPFSFYGVPQSHYTLSTNGLLQFVAAGGVGSAASVATTLPSTAAPGNIVAAFWNPLVSDANSFTHWQVFGAAPARHMVVEWVDYAFGRASRVTFQARLDEATGQVQVSFCDLRVNETFDDEYPGTVSAVGMQNADRTVGHVALLHSPDALRRTRRYTFDPR